MTGKNLYTAYMQLFGIRALKIASPLKLKTLAPGLSNYLCLPMVKSGVGMVNNKALFTQGQSFYWEGTLTYFRESRNEHESIQSP